MGPTIYDLLDKLQAMQQEARRAVLQAADSLGVQSIPHDSVESGTRTIPEIIRHSLSLADMVLNQLHHINLQIGHSGAEKEASYAQTR